VLFGQSQVVMHIFEILQIKTGPKSIITAQNNF